MKRKFKYYKRTEKWKVVVTVIFSIIVGITASIIVYSILCYIHRDAFNSYPGEITYDNLDKIADTIISKINMKKFNQLDEEIDDIEETIKDSLYTNMDEIKYELNSSSTFIYIHLYKPESNEKDFLVRPAAINIKFSSNNLELIEKSRNFLSENLYIKNIEVSIYLISFAIGCILTLILICCLMCSVILKFRFSR